MDVCSTCRAVVDPGVSNVKYLPKWRDLEMGESWHRPRGSAWCFVGIGRLYPHVGRPQYSWTVVGPDL